jgi:anti-anti-sigma factor
MGVERLVPRGEGGKGVMTDQPALYEISIDSFATLPVVRLVGEFDLRAAPDLRESLVGVLDPEPERGADEAPNGRVGAVLIDMEGLRFLDSTIISVLLSADQLAQEKGRQVRFAAVPSNVARIFGVTGIEGVLKTYSSLEEAARAEG